MIDLPLSAAVDAQSSGAQPGPPAGSSPKPKSGLLADCAETVVHPSPLPPRPMLRRATLSSKPAHRAKHVAKHKRPAIKRAHVKKKAAHHHRRPIRHRRPAKPHQPTFQRLTYASPLCDRPSPAMRTMLGLPENIYGLTQSPVVAAQEDVHSINTLPPVLDTGSGVIGTPLAPIIGFPSGPGFPIVPTGPVIFPPVGPPPPPPPPPSPIPEPTGWAAMMAGMVMIGGAMRRRKKGNGISRA